MGKGDKRSKRGKIWRGTTGKTRQKRKRTRTKQSASARPSSPKS